MSGAIDTGPRPLSVRLLTEPTAEDRAYARRMPGRSDQSVNRRVATVVEVLTARMPELAEQVTQRILKQIDGYEGGPVPRDDLFTSCLANLTFMFGRLGAAAPPDLSAPRETGRRRAEQGAPLAAVMSAFRIGCAFMWEAVVAEGRGSGLLSDADLVELGTEVWAVNEEFTAEVASAYRDALTERLLLRDQERSALVAALLEGRIADTATVWEAADLLALPYQGFFAVVAAEARELARQPLPLIENRLHTRDVGSAWRLLPDLQVGIVSLRSPEALETVVDMLRPVTTGRVGVSPAYAGLERTPQALHLARIALATAAPGAAEVSVFDDGPVSMLVVSSPTTSYRIATRVLGPVLDMASEERDVLLDTLGTYFAVQGSAAESGKRLFCHPNTVRHRLKRIENLTGRSLEDPLGSAELYVALEAIRRLPDRAGES
jgi:PucR C-terminal helix-turn-helix domain/GGDEF-like domain